MGAKVSKQKPPKKLKGTTVHVQKQKESKEGKESIKDLLYNATDMPLAKPGTDHLPNIVRAAGFKAIDELASVALSTFKNSGRGVKLRGAETERLQNVVGLSKAVVDSLEWDEFCDVAAFVAEVVRCIKLNTILVGAAAVWYESQRKSDHTIQLSTEKREELRLSVFWCFLMHAVVKRTVFQPCGEENCILEELMTGFENKRKEDEDKWKKNINAFAKMKVWGIDVLLTSILDVKKKRTIDSKSGDGLKVSANILMAMYSDLKSGNDANAAAAFELMAQSHDQQPIKGLHNEIDHVYDMHDGVPIGAKAFSPPLPKVWANLYSSWNLAFVSGAYSYVPMFWAKLVAPVVLATYQEVDPGLYLLPRIIALYMFMQYSIQTIIENPGELRYYQMPLADGKLREHSEWRMTLSDATTLWGEFNQVAANQFRARIDKIIEDNYGVGFEVCQDVQRAGLTAAWTVLKGMIKTFCQQRKEKSATKSATPAGLGDEDDAGKDEADFVASLQSLASGVLAKKD